MTYLLSFRRFTEILLGTLDFSSSRNDKPGSYFVTIPNLLIYDGAFDVQV